jgi:uncharacterized delta-60 repeat protein
MPATRWSRAVPTDRPIRARRPDPRLAQAVRAALSAEPLEPRRLFAAFQVDTDFVTEAVATYPDGRTLVVGYEYENPANTFSKRLDVLARFLPNGSPDNTFGEQGKVLVKADLNGDGQDDDSAAYSVILQDDDPEDPNDGKILVAGASYTPVDESDDEEDPNPTSQGPSFILSSYNANGTPNADFGGGRIRIDFAPGNTQNADIAYAIAFQGNDVLVAGHTGNYFSHSGDDYAVVRYKANGTFDGDFGDNGFIETDMMEDPDGIGFRDSIGAIVVEPDGKFVVAGTCGQTTLDDDTVMSIVGLCRYTKDGRLDDNFGDGGKMLLTQLGTEQYDDDNDLTGENTSDYAVGLARTSNGKYIVASTTPDNVRDFGMVRLNSNGTIDDNFGDEGFVRTGMGGIDDADQVLLLGSQIVVLGTTTSVNTGAGTATVKSAIAVYDSNGKLDEDFGDDGQAFFDELTVNLPSPTGIGPLADHSGSIAQRLRGAANGGEITTTRSKTSDDSSLRRLQADVVAPTASLAPVAAVTTAGGTGNDLVVTFTDIGNVDASTITPANILVTRNGGGMPLAVASATPDSLDDGTTRTATYRLVAPGGTWDAADNGTYTVTLQAGQVADTGGNTVGSKNLGTFTVSVTAAAPTATFAGSSVTVPGGATHTFTVTYADSDGLVARGSLVPANVSVTGPGGALVVTGVTAQPDADSASIVATYTVEAPGGTWDAADAGDYAVELLANQVRDTANNFVAAGTLGTFAVTLGGVAGAPTATLQPVGAVTAGSVSHTFTITYADADGAVDVSTIGPADVTVVRAGGTQLSVTAALPDVNANGTPRSVTYTVQGPGGSWNAADNGTYTIALAANQVADADGVFAAAGSLGTFTVNLGGGGAPATASVADVNARGASSYEFTVTFNGGSALDPATLGDDDLLVSGPGGFGAFAQLVAVNGNAATYRFLPPGGTWNARDAGAYTVALQSGAVRDTAGGPIGSGTIGTFNVAIAGATGTPLGSFGTINGVQTKLPVTDGDGTITTLSLTGGGSGQAFLNGDRIDLVLTGTTGASSLSFKAKGGDGRVKLGDISVDGGLRQINGKTADLSGEFTAGSAVGKVLLGNATDAAITLGSGGLTTLQLGQVTNLALASASPIKSLKANAWADDGADDVINATTLSGITVRGDFAADVNAQSIGNAKFGSLTGARLISGSGIGKVAAGAITGSRIFAAVTDANGGLPAALDGFSDTATLLAGVSVKGTFSNSLIAAPIIGKASLRTVDPANGGSPFGIAADTIRSASASANGRITSKNATDPTQSVGQGDFVIRVV